MLSARSVSRGKAGAIQSMTKNSDDMRGSRPARGSNTADLLGSNSEIARKLKQYHDELLSLQVPDRFAELLTRLEQAELEGRLVQADAKTETGAKAED